MKRAQTVDGDQIMALIGSQLAAAGKAAGGGVVATVMSNLGLERFLQPRAELLRTKVGDRYVLEAMRAGGLQCRRRAVGPHDPADYATTGDGTIAALQVLAALVQSGKTAERAAPFVRSRAAAFEERAFLRRQAAGSCRCVSASSPQPRPSLNGAGAWSSAPRAPSLSSA
jgi:phosphomannomutase